MKKSDNLTVKKSTPYLLSASILLLGVTAAVIGEVLNNYHFEMYYKASEIVYFLKDQILPLLIVFLSIWLYKAKIISKKTKIVLALILAYLAISSLSFGLRGMWSVVTSEFFTFRAALAIMVTILTSAIMLLLILLIADNNKRIGITIMVCSGLLIPVHCFYAAEELYNLVNHLYPDVTSWGYFLSDFAYILLYSAVIIFACTYIRHECQKDS
ncbi:MAG: hypothetical protein WCN92_06820 [Eubacteriales bacterium]